jgi:hypothetical protein
MFAGRGTGLAAAGAHRAPVGTSPLLILTHSRSFAIAPAPGVAVHDEAAVASRAPDAGGLRALPSIRILLFSACCCSFLHSGAICLGVMSPAVLPIRWITIKKTHHSAILLGSKSGNIW